MNKASALAPDGERGSSQSDDNSQQRIVAGEAPSEDSRDFSTYQVRFSTFWTSGAQTPNAFGLKGKGTIEFRGNAIFVRGWDSDFFGIGKPAGEDFERTRCFDSCSDGKIVRFSVRTKDGGLLPMQFWAVNEDIAAKIASELPRTVSDEVKAVQDYTARLDSIGRNGKITITLIAINALVFICVALSGGGVWSPNVVVLRGWGTMYGPAVRAGEWWRLVSACFLHFGLLHLVMNMITLAFVGAFAEREFGGPRFALMYLLSGVLGATCSLLWNSNIDSAGASGAIFGLYGALLVVRFRKDLDIPPFLLKQQQGIAVAFILSNVYISLRLHLHVDYAAHAGGLVGGMLVGFVLATPLTSDSAKDKSRANRFEIGIISLAAIGALLMIVPNFRIARSVPEPLPESVKRLLDEEVEVHGVAMKILACVQSGALSKAYCRTRLTTEVEPRMARIRVDVAVVGKSYETRAQRAALLSATFLDQMGLAASLLEGASALESEKLVADARNKLNDAGATLSELQQIRKSDQ